MSWDEEERTIEECWDNPKNPRKISKEAFNNIVNLLKKNGYHQRITINRDNMILGGHQRKKALIEAGWSKKSLIKVLVPCRMLTDTEINSITISDNGAFGTFDIDVLANEYEISDLIDWGVHPCVFDMFEEKPEKTKKEPKQQTCPECGHQWEK